MKAGILARIEWPTVLLIVANYLVWFSLVLFGDHLFAPLWVLLAGLSTALYWSLVHEVVHLHPTRWKILNFALVYIPIGWTYALGRFGDGHLQHHATGELTDPFDDPESWYLARRDWKSSPGWVRFLLTVNNTMAGRLVIGPLVTLWRMVSGDIALVLRGGSEARKVALAWLAHVPGVVLLAWFVHAWSNIALWQFVLAAYVGIAVILIRTFLEHQAAEGHGERTVIIEDRGLLAFLFLFNNLHVVHHTRPGLAWYLLPGFYRRHREAFIRRNKGYVYPSYGAVFARYLLRPKEPVAHPFVA
ncbi:MAG: fatty acid desaturase [Rhizobiaceae bacterium]